MKEEEKDNNNNDKVTKDDKVDKDDKVFKDKVDKNVEDNKEEEEIFFLNKS